MSFLMKLVIMSRQHNIVLHICIVCNNSRIYLKPKINVKSRFLSLTASAATSLLLINSGIQADWKEEMTLKSVLTEQ